MREREIYKRESERDLTALQPLRGRSSRRTRKRGVMQRLDIAAPASPSLSPSPWEVTDENSEENTGKRSIYEDEKRQRNALALFSFSSAY